MSLSIGEENERMLQSRPQWIIPILFKRNPADAEKDAAVRNLERPRDWTVRNPKRVLCPLCRRRNTVKLLAASPASGPQAAIEHYECSYRGCRGLKWDL